MSTAASRLQRLLLLLPRFAEQQSQSIDALARALDVDRETILADLQALVERYDDMVGFDDPVNVTIRGDTATVTTDHFLRPMRVTASELCALELGLGVLAREDEPVRYETLEALRAKLTRCITELPSDAAFAGLRDAALIGADDGSVLAAIRRALRLGRCVEIDYQRPGDAEAGTRSVQPYALIFHHGAWYLVGHCERADAMRLFRVDRVTDCTVTDRPAPVPEWFSLDDLMVNGHPFVTPEPPPPLMLWYSPSIARWIAERDGQPLEADGSAVRTLPLADREWAIRHVLQYGPDARILAPAELAEEVVERLRGMAAGRR